MLRKRLPLLVALVLSTAAYAAVYVDETSLSEGALFAADPQFQSVGAVHRFYDGAWGWGSGVLIGPSWVLTAGHVVEAGVSEVTFSLGSNIYADPTHLVSADAWYCYPGFNSEPGHDDDIALIHLSSPICDVSPAERFYGTDLRGTNVFIAGYGQPGFSGYGSWDIDGAKRAGRNVAEHFGTDVDYLSADEQFWVADFDWQDIPLLYQVSPGDSGGGWFAEINGRPQLVGITSWAEVTDYFGRDSSSGAIRTSLYNSWIDQVTGLPEPATLSLLLLGLPLLRSRRLA